MQGVDPVGERTALIEHRAGQPCQSFGDRSSLSMILGVSTDRAADHAEDFGNALGGILALAFAYAYAIRHAVELPLQKLRARYRHAAPPISAAMPVEGI